MSTRVYFINTRTAVDFRVKTFVPFEVGNRVCLVRKIDRQLKGAICRGRVPNNTFWKNSFESVRRTESRAIHLSAFGVVCVPRNAKIFDFIKSLG